MKGRLWKTGEVSCNIKGKENGHKFLPNYRWYRKLQLAHDTNKDLFKSHDILKDDMVYSQVT